MCNLNVIIILDCSSKCEKCNGPLASNCVICGTNKQLNNETGTCEDVCSLTNEFVDHNDNNQCKKCDA